MAIKLQINSQEALERLIGGDTEIEIEIRESIVQEFAKKHLKALTPQVVDKYLVELQKYVKPYIEEQFFRQTKDGWSNKLVPNELTKKLREEISASMFESKIREIIESRVTAALDVLTPKLIEQRIAAYAEHEISLRVSKAIREKFNL